MADNIPTMKDGKLVEEGTPTADMDAPREALTGMLRATALADCPAV